MGYLFVIVLGGLTPAAIYLAGYKLWVFIVLGLLWLAALVVSLVKGHRGFGGGPRTDLLIVLTGAFITAAIIIPRYNAQKPCYQGQTALRKLVDAGNEYFSQHKTFTTNINLLKFEQNPHLYIMISRGDDQSFASAAAHLSCDENNDGTPDLLMWDSAREGLQ